MTRSAPKHGFDRRVLGILATVFCLSLNNVGYAQNADSSVDDAGKLLGDVQQSLKEERAEREELAAKEKKLVSDLMRIRERMVESAALVRKHEETMSQLELRLSELELLEIEKARILAQERADFAKVLLALERLARFPPEAMIAQPNSPADTVRTAILLRSIVPEIERRAARLRYEIESLARARDQTVQRRAELEKERAALTRETAALDELLVEKRRLKAQTKAERNAAEARVAFLNKEARDLRDLVSRLEQERREREAALQVAPPKPDPADAAQPETTVERAIQPVLTGTPITTRQGQLPLPAVGTLVGQYGDVNNNGVKLRGIRVETRARAQVIAPHEGVAVYVGEFRGYGQLLIIEHAGGYHTLLAGMARIDSEMGQHILSGEPVGIMGNGDLGDPVLYVELRRSGRPINPLPWIAARDTIPQG